LRVLRLSKALKMSRTAIISDIHANSVALEAVFEDAKTQGVNNFACLGDVVGYGPDPSECVRLIQELNCITIKGNHDEYVADGYDLSNFNDEAQEALLWTRSNLSTPQKDWLASLPYTRRLGRNELVHATLDEPEQWKYVLNRLDASILLKKQRSTITFFGHTHKPMAFHQVNGETNKLDESDIEINQNHKYLINVGSVGQPRDGEVKASYVIFDRTARTVENRRVNYDIDITVQRIKNSTLPNSLAQRLLEAS